MSTVYTIVGRLCQTPTSKRGLRKRDRVSGSIGVKNAIRFGYPETFPVRFARKFGKLSAGGKRRNSTQTYRDCAAVTREISVRARTRRCVSNCSLVWTLQRA